MKAKLKIKVKCPKCKIEFFYHDCEFRPFCSERCKLIDLGLWLSESYALESATEGEGEQEGNGGNERE